MLPIDDAHVRWSLIKYWAGLIDAGHLEPLIEGGFTPELLDALRNRRIHEIDRIAQDTSIGIHVRVDSQQLSAAFVRLDAIRRDKECLEYFVKHGAPTKWLIRIFRTTSQELRGVREALCGDTATGGRANLPGPAVRERIHLAWAEIRATAEDPALAGRPERTRERDWVYALHQRFPDYTIGALWTVLNEFDEAEPRSASPVLNRPAV